MDGARECWVCLEATDPDGAAAAPTGCACRGTAGHAHLSCLLANAQHAADDADGATTDQKSWFVGQKSWSGCPTCKQDYTGPISVGLARARCGLHRGRPEPDINVINVRAHLAVVLMNERKYAEARPLLEDRLVAMRRRFGDEAHATLDCMVQLANCRHQRGGPAAALPLLEEALPACRRTRARSSMIMCMILLAAVYPLLDKPTAARSTAEEMMELVRDAGAVTAGSITEANQAIGALGVVLGTVGDVQAGMSLLEEALTNARRGLGEAHPITQRAAQSLAESLQCASARSAQLGLPPPTDLRAFGMLVGLRARPELNGKLVWVLGFGRGRYRVRIDEKGGAPSDKPLAIKPANIKCVPGLQFYGYNKVVNAAFIADNTLVCNDSVIVFARGARVLLFETANLCATQTQAGARHSRSRGGPAQPARVEWQARARAELRRGEGAVQVTRQGPGGAPGCEARVLQARVDGGAGAQAACGCEEGRDRAVCARGP